MERLLGRVAIVTGGGGGIGRATALRFAAEGALVAVADLDGDAADRVAAEVRANGGDAISLTVDVSDEDAAAAMVAETASNFGGLDILHNNAALMSRGVDFRDGDIAKADSSIFTRMMAVNALGPMLACKYSIPHFLERGRGAIVNTVSTAAVRGWGPGPIYAMTKAALDELTRCVAVQYGKRNIRCNSIAPGAIQTAATPWEGDEKRNQRLKDVLTPRLGKPEDIAAAAAFLASDDAEYITGQTITADGGWSSYIAAL